MAEPTVFVFETKPRWTPELQRQFNDEDIRVRNCPSTSELVTLLESCTVSGDTTPAFVVVLDFAAGAAECLQFLGRLISRAGPWPIIVIGSSRTAELEWSVRELGALEFVVDYISGEDLARLCRRQLAGRQQIG